MQTDEKPGPTNVVPCAAATVIRQVQTSLDDLDTAIFL